MRSYKDVLCSYFPQVARNLVALADHIIMWKSVRAPPPLLSLRGRIIE